MSKRYRFTKEDFKIITQWGVEYYKEHKQECDKLAEMVGLIG